MYLAGISVRRVEDITEAQWGNPCQPSTVSNLNGGSRSEGAGHSTSRIAASLDAIVS